MPRIHVAHVLCWQRLLYGSTRQQTALVLPRVWPHRAAHPERPTGGGSNVASRPRYALIPVTTRFSVVRCLTGTMVRLDGRSAREEQGVARRTETIPVLAACCGTGEGD